MIIAIDGPAASGKSTVARALAARVGANYLDTGAMYRAIAAEALRTGIPADDSGALARLASSVSIAFEHERGQALPSRVLIDGRDVTREIRTPAVDTAVSPVSAVPGVRTAMVGIQRELGRTGDWVVEGRDIGTIVFPQAEVKVFLTATAAERARRRAIDMEALGVEVDIDEMRRRIEARDRYDSTREASPLVAADDAVPLDTTGMTIEQVIDRIADLVAERR